MTNDEADAEFREVALETLGKDVDLNAEKYSKVAAAYRRSYAKLVEVGAPREGIKKTLSTVLERIRDGAEAASGDVSPGDLLPNVPIPPKQEVIDTDFADDDLI